MGCASSSAQDDERGSAGRRGARRAATESLPDEPWESTVRSANGAFAPWSVSAARHSAAALACTRVHTGSPAPYVTHPRATGWLFENEDNTIRKAMRVSMDAPDAEAFSKEQARVLQRAFRLGRVTFVLRHA